MLEAVEKSLGRIKELPPLPLAARHILRALNGDDVVITDLVSAVELDPVVTARLISIANSALFHTTHPCTNIRDAIVRLGLQETKQLVLPIVLAAFFDLGRCPNFRVDEYWKEILLVAMGARKLCECAGDRVDETLLRSAYTAGLLHNIGVLALVHIYPEEMNQLFRQVTNIHCNNSAMAEKLGIDPCEASYIVLSSWKVPDEISQVARDMYRDENASRSSPADLTVLIRFIVNWYAEDFRGISIPYDLQGLGITSDHLMKAQTLIRRDMPPLVKIAGMLNYY